MNPKVNQILEDIKDMMGDVAWGPQIPSRVKISDFQKAEAGVGEASNDIDTQDAIDFYLNNISQALVDEFDLDDESAYDYVEQAADELEGDGMLPPLPSPSDSDYTSALWLGSAKSMGFEGYCIKSVRDQVASVTSLRSSSDME